MKTEPNTSAFPEVQSETNRDMQVSEIYSQGGLTKREYFAAKALQGLLSAVDVKDFESIELVTASLRIANELIEQLNKEI